MWRRRVEASIGHRTCGVRGARPGIASIISFGCTAGVRAVAVAGSFGLDAAAVGTVIAMEAKRRMSPVQDGETEQRIRALEDLPTSNPGPRRIAPGAACSSRSIQHRGTWRIVRGFVTASRIVPSSRVSSGTLPPFFLSLDVFDASVLAFSMLPSHRLSKKWMRPVKMEESQQRKTRNGWGNAATEAETRILLLCIAVGIVRMPAEQRGQRKVHEELHAFQGLFIAIPLQYLRTPRAQHARPAAFFACR